MSTIMWLSKVLLCCYSTQRRIKFRISIIIGVFISHYSESLGVITVIMMRQYISITVIFIVHFSNTKTFLKGVHMKPIITVMTLFLLIYLDKYLECRYSWILIDGWMDADGWLDGIVDDDDVKIESTLKKILIQASVKIFKRFTVLQGLSIVKYTIDMSLDTIKKKDFSYITALNTMALIRFNCADAWNVTFFSYNWK